MALISLPHEIRFPEHVPHGFPYFDNTETRLLDASGEYLSIVFFVPKSCTVSKIGYILTSSTLAGTLSVGLYTVDSSGNPTATAYGGMVAGDTVNPSAGAATVSLATPATAVAGNLVAAKVHLSAYTSGNVNIRYTNIQTSDRGSHPYMVHSTGAGATKAVGVALIWLELNDGTCLFLNQCSARVSENALTIGNTSTPDEYANYFITPFAMRVLGVWFDFTRGNGPTVNCRFQLFDTNGSSTLGSCSIDVASDSPSTALPRGPYHCYFSSPITLASSATYWVSYAPATTGRDWYTISYSNAQSKMLGWDSAWHLATRTDAGAWGGTDTSKYVPLGIIVDQMYDIPTAGGLITHPGMAGGMRG